MTFIDRVDPAVRPILESPLLPDLDFSIGIERIRAGLKKQRAEVAAAEPAVPDVKTRDIWVPGFAEGDDEIVMRVYEPDAHAAPSAGLYWIHGGGMVVGTYDDNDFQCKTWASKFSVPVISVEYRLAPENPYPAPLQDCYAGLRWLYRNAASVGIDAARITVAGASAGGGLAAGTVLFARDQGEVPVHAQVLIYPMIDDRDATPSNREITYAKCWNRDANKWGWSAYLGDLYGADDVPLYAAPARASADDLRGLPPTFIDVGELDAFRDEDIEYAQKLLQAGVATDLVVTAGAFHASEAYNPKATSSRRIVAARLDALGRALA